MKGHVKEEIAGCLRGHDDHGIDHRSETLDAGIVDTDNESRRFRCDPTVREACVVERGESANCEDASHIEEHKAEAISLCGWLRRGFISPLVTTRSSSAKVKGKAERTMISTKAMKRPVAPGGARCWLLLVLCSSGNLEYRVVVGRRPPEEDE